MFPRRPLLLRISPNPFAFIPIPPMSLSSRNRSISNTFRHILLCIAPVCEGMHYHKTGVPWQMNKIFFIAKFHYPKISFTGQSGIRLSITHFSPLCKTRKDCYNGRKRKGALEWSCKRGGLRTRRADWKRKSAPTTCWTGWVWHTRGSTTHRL